MTVDEKEIVIPRTQNQDGLLEYFAVKVAERLAPDEAPVRFVVTKTDDKNYYCELGALSDEGGFSASLKSSIFEFKKRNFENTDEFNAVLLIPTGIGAEIGGHSGDGGPVARLIASACDNLITHPNAVNAADINELTENTLYVEGSVLSRLLMGAIGLQKVRSNRVMLVVDEHSDKTFHEAAINSASAARSAFGLDCPLVVTMGDRVLMKSLYASSGRAVGRVEELERLYELLKKYRGQYDAVALSSQIELPREFEEAYFCGTKEGMLNPWGGAEAMLTHAVSLLFDVQSAHSPMVLSKDIADMDVGIVDPRKAADAVSVSYLHCILKGLHRSPRIIANPSLDGRAGILTAANVSCLIVPDGCVGLPTLAALEQGIPVIAVKENKNCMRNKLEELPFAPGKLFVVDNYLEAVGIMRALAGGVAPESVRRPLAHTAVHKINGERKEEIAFVRDENSIAESEAKSALHVV